MAEEEPAREKPKWSLRGRTPAAPGVDGGRGAKTKRADEEGSKGGGGASAASDAEICASEGSGRRQRAQTASARSERRQRAHAAGQLDHGRDSSGGRERVPNHVRAAKRQVIRRPAALVRLPAFLLHQLPARRSACGEKSRGVRLASKLYIGSLLSSPSTK